MQNVETVNRSLIVHKRVLRLMGNRFEISVVSADESWANERIDLAVAEISRIEKLLTTFSEDTAALSMRPGTW